MSKPSKVDKEKTIEELTAICNEAVRAYKEAKLATAKAMYALKVARKNLKERLDEKWLP